MKFGRKQWRWWYIQVDERYGKRFQVYKGVDEYAVYMNEDIANAQICNNMYEFYFCFSNALVTR